MNKLAKLFRALGLVIRKPALLNLVLNDEEVNKKMVIEKYLLSAGLPVVDLLDIVPNFREKIDPFCFLDGGSTPPDLGLLKALAASFPSCEYFEIGTWRGESVANVASVATHCTTLNLPDEEMRKLGMSKDYVQSHRFFSEKLQNVTHLQHNSLTFDFQSLQQKFDLIFIDGDHHYESVRSDTANAFRLLKDERSMIVWHDYSHTPSSGIRWDVVRGILDGAPKEKQAGLYHVSNTLCALYSSQPLVSKQVSLFDPPNKYFTVTLTTQRI